MEHCVRVEGEMDPDVNDPESHEVQLPAASRLNKFASPQLEHDPLFAAENLPAAHGTEVLEPSQANPEAQGEHAVREPATPPQV